MIDERLLRCEWLAPDLYATALLERDAGQAGGQATLTARVPIEREATMRNSVKGSRRPWDTDLGHELNITCCSVDRV